MIISNINETKTHLSKLIQRALAGDEVIISRGKEPLVKLVPYIQDTSPRTGGQWSGLAAGLDTGSHFEFTDDEINTLFYAPQTSEEE